MSKFIHHPEYGSRNLKGLRTMGSYVTPWMDELHESSCSNNLYMQSCLSFKFFFFTSLQGHLHPLLVSEVNKWHFKFLKWLELKYV
jgi:hypothetical protein